MSRIGNLIKKAQSYKGQEFKQPRMFVPSGMIVPETAKNSMARQLYQAGIITKDDYEKMLGVSYDGDFKLNEEDFGDEAFSAFREEFTLSQLSEYYDDYGTEDDDKGRGNGDTNGNPDRKEAVQSSSGTSTNTDVQQDNVEVVPNEQKSEP